MKCRICNSEIEAFMSFGDMPIANGFLEADQFDDEYFFELAPAFCETCSTLQIVEQPEPERMRPHLERWMHHQGDIPGQNPRRLRP